ncbi:MAG: hypothetical protein ABFE13_12110 [Phycisphaerales bacterium]
MTLDPSARNVRAVLPSPSTPVCTVYSPSGAAYMKVTPSDDVLELVVRPRTVTQSLVYAPIITHKIADTTTTIAAADPDDLAKSKTAIDEILADTNTHIASTTYHAAAGTAWVAGHLVDDDTNLSTADNMASLATGYVLADELDDDVTAHLASVVFHLKATTATDFGGTPATEGALRTKVNLLRTAMLAHFADATAHSVADPINAALVTATTVGSDEASDQTLINLLKTYWNSHCAVGDATAGDLAAVVVAANAAKAGLLAHMADTTVAHGGVGDATNHATLLAVADASDLATSITLIHAEKDTYNAHCAIVDGGAYITAGPVGLPIIWKCRGSFWAKTDTSAGVFTTAEFKSV